MPTASGYPDVATLLTVYGNAAGNLFRQSTIAELLTAFGTIPVANGGTGYTGGAWTGYVGTITPGAGAITTQASDCSYLQIGKMVLVNGNVQISNIGTASGLVNINVPIAPRVGVFLPGREQAVVGKMFSVQMAAGSLSATIFYYDNTVPTFANGITFTFSGSYEAQ